MQGKAVRLQRIINPLTHRTLIVPLDNSLLSGPDGGLMHMDEKVRQIVAGGADAVMGFYGLFAHHGQLLQGRSGLLNITASTTLGAHTRKVLVGSVEQAVALGMDGVTVHVNMSSRYEPSMLKILGDISRECARLGMPLMAQVYPRTENEYGKGDNNYHDLQRDEPQKYTAMVRHCVRVAVDLGADIVKTQYTGSADSFASVVQCASGVPVVMAGGQETTDLAVLQKVYNALQAGATGACVGRNVFNHTDTEMMTAALRMVVHDGLSPEDALQAAGKEAHSRRDSSD